MIRKNFYLGFLGFLGFFSSRYFMTGDITSFAYLGFFSFFGFFFLGKIQGQRRKKVGIGTTLHQIMILLENQGFLLE